MTDNQSIKIRLFEPHFDEAEYKMVRRAMENGYLNEGPYVREFEQKFANFVHAKYCVVVPSGRIALYMALMQQDPVLAHIPAYYGIFAAQAAKEAYVDMYLVDVDKNGCTTKDYPCLIGINANGRLSISYEIEDCCQHINWHSRNVVSCYSFHSTKMLTLGGIGGAICCDDSETYETLRIIKDHGRSVKGDLHPNWGSNFKMADINAAFGIAQLKKLPGKIIRFYKMYKLYRELIGEKVGWIEGAPQWRIDCLVNDPQRVVEEMGKFGIQCQRFYLPTYRQPQFQDDPSKYPNCEYLYQHGLYLPSSTFMTDEQIQFVCEKLKGVLSSQ